VAGIRQRGRALRYLWLEREYASGTEETLGAGGFAIRADVSNSPDLDTMFATINREFGHLDGIFANAGYSDFLCSKM